MPACCQSSVLVCGCQVFPFSLNAKGECGFTEIRMSNNRKGTEEMSKAVAKGYEGVANGLGHGIAACLSGVV